MICDFVLRPGLNSDGFVGNGTVLANAVFEAEGELYSRQLSVAHDPLINLFVGIDPSPCDTDGVWPEEAG